MYLSASNGEPNDIVAKTLQLGIHLLSGGNKGIQKVYFFCNFFKKFFYENIKMLISYLQLKKDLRFFASLAGLMSKCSVLNLEMFERQIKVINLILIIQYY